MNNCGKKYKRFSAISTLLLILLLVKGFDLNAQNGTGNADTVIAGEPEEAIIDTVLEDSVEASTVKEQFDFIKRTTSGFYSDTIGERKIPGEVQREMKNDPAFWYADNEFKKINKEQTDSGERPRIPKGLEIILWIIIIAGFTGVIVWYLASSNISLFRKKPVPLNSDDEEAETNDIFRINYPKEIEKAVLNGNYRFAVRLMYLQLLKNLSDRQIISYKQEYTNFEYLLQLNPSAYYHDFFRITRNYEFCWYGQFDIRSAEFEIIKNDFIGLEQKMKMN